RDEVDGRLVHSVQEYLAVMKQLQEDVAYRIALGRRGRQKVCAAYSGENNALQMEKQLFEVLRREPVIHDFQRILGATPFEWFLRFTGPDREKLIDPILRKQLWIEKPIYLAENKSSVYQFLRYLEDPKLRELVEQS
nr:hypothetical protein [Lachnospiraceae bacterium]